MLKMKVQTHALLQNQQTVYHCDCTGVWTFCVLAVIKGIFGYHYSFLRYKTLEVYHVSWA